MELKLLKAVRRGSNKFLLIYSIFFNVFMFGQSQTSSESSLVLPNINPPSPESFKFVEFGKNKVNEYAGKLNLNIPIYEYTAGKIKLPITLNYSGAGVKVEDISSWVGINWNLSVGGLITRQINDSSDEGYAFRTIVDEVHLKNNANDLCAPASQYYWQLAANDEFNDTEVDIFNFSFMGYSGSFYLNSNFAPVYIENENEIKIEIVGTSSNNQDNLLLNNTFCITTPDGIKYYFGGSAIENTRVLSGAHNINADGVTSYFLCSIEHPLNGTVIFEYDSIIQTTQDLSKSHSVIASSSDLDPKYYLSNIVESKFRTRVYGAKRLAKIRSLDNDIEIIFERNDYVANRNFCSVLNNIQIFKKNIPITILKKVNFEYEAKILPQDLNNDFVNASRFFLTKVKINNELDTQGDKHQQYILEYDSPFKLPNRMSNSRDALGYFNNTTKPSLIPIDSRYSYHQPFLVFGDLNPNFNFGKYGSLIKIIYPTKGYSTFEYEPLPNKKKLIKIYGLSINSFPQNDMYDPTVFNIPGYNYCCGLQELNFYNAPNVFINQTITFKINIWKGPHVNSASLNGQGVRFKITDNTEPSLSQSYTKLLTSGYNIDYSFNFIKDHSYSFRLFFLNDYESIDPDSKTFGATVNLSIDEGYESIQGLGIRLKRQKDFSFTDILTNHQRYYYGSINGGYNKVENYPSLNYYPKQTYRAVNGSGPESATYWYWQTTFTSEIADEYRRLMLNPELFPIVSTSFGGDNFENGGTEKNFINLTDTHIKRVQLESDGCWPNAYSNPPTFCGNPNNLPWYLRTLKHDEAENYMSWEKTKNSHFNGNLVSERLYVKNNNNLFKIKETKNDFILTLDFSKTITNLVARRMDTSGGSMQHNFCPQNPNLWLNSLMAVYFGYYNTRVFSLKQIESKTIEYIEPVSMTDYSNFKQSFIDENLFPYDFEGEITDEPIIITTPTQDNIEINYKKIITKQTFEYGNLKGLPIKITTTSSDGSSKEIINSYVNDLSQITGLNGPQINAYNSMKSQNNVVMPIQVKETKNQTELLSTKITTFKQVTLNGYVPEFIKYIKGTNTIEDRIVFDEYDSKGNPTLMYLKDGATTKYLYNANNQVIAKIENFSGFLNPNTNSITVDICQFIKSFPYSLVTVFNYDPLTNNLISTIDSKCDKITYEYDALNALKFVKDKNGNILSENEYHYKN
jgi:hypothetical protein